MECVVKVCRNRWNCRKVGISFHRFPQDAFLRAVWISATGWRNDIFNNSLVCSDHFAESDLVRHKKKTLLTEGAFPRIKLQAEEENSEAVTTNSAQPNIAGSVHYDEMKTSGDCIMNVAMTGHLNEAMNISTPITCGGLFGVARQDQPDADAIFLNRVYDQLTPAGRMIYAPQADLSEAMDISEPIVHVHTGMYGVARQNYSDADVIFTDRACVKSSLDIHTTDSMVCSSSSPKAVGIGSHDPSSLVTVN